jgi:DNA-binding NtrC family response regulator
MYGKASMRPAPADTPIILVDDEREALTLLRSILENEGFTNVTTFDDGRDLLKHLESNPATVIVLDLMMPNIPGIRLLEKIDPKNSGISVIVVTAEQQIDMAVECMKLGAVDYLTKPVIVKRFMNSIQRGVELCRLQQEIDASNTQAIPGQDAAQLAPAIITRNREMIALINYVDVVARSSQPILITGETGVGKELFAQAIHSLSKRTGQFVSVNVAGLDDTLFSDTLFGHKKGSFTGAISDRDGLIKKAAQGTLFLDEIGDLNSFSQIKLLRLLQENEYYPLGSDIPQQNSARLVVATNQNLKQLMLEGKFRKDLYYRLCSHQVNIPPLRNRRDDLPLLLDQFMESAAKSMGKQQVTYRKELLDLLGTYDFPGNVRELQAMVLDAVTRTTTPMVHASTFRGLISRERSSDDASADTPSKDGDVQLVFKHFPTMEQAEIELIRRALELTNNNQSLAAQMLGISRQTLNNRLRRVKNNSHQ